MRMVQNTQSIDSIMEDAAAQIKGILLDNLNSEKILWEEVDFITKDTTKEHDLCYVVRQNGILIFREYSVNQYFLADESRFIILLNDGLYSFESRQFFRDNLFYPVLFTKKEKAVDYLVYGKEALLRIDKKKRQYEALEGNPAFSGYLAQIRS